MAFFNTDVKRIDTSGMQKAIQQIKPSSTMLALSNTMSKLDEIVDRRDKEQYSKTALEKIKGVQDPMEALNMVSQLDVGRMTDDSKQTLKFGLDSLTQRQALANQEEQLVPQDIRILESIGLKPTMENIEKLRMAGKDKSSSSSPTDFQMKYNAYLDTVPKGNKPLTPSEFEVEQKMQIARGYDETYRNAQDIMQEKDFIGTYGELGEKEKIAQARTIAKKRAILNDPYKAKVYGQRELEKLKIKARREGKDVADYLPEMSTDDVALLSQGEQSSPLFTKLKDNIGMGTSIKSIKDEADLIMSISEEDYNKGVGANLIADIKSSIPQNWLTLSSDERKSLVTKISTDSRLGNIFFTYLNDVNKGAPSDADMKLMEKIVTAGASGNIVAMKTALSTFVNGATKKAKNDISSASKHIPISMRNDSDIINSIESYNYKGDRNYNSKKQSNNGVKIIDKNTISPERKTELNNILGI